MAEKPVDELESPDIIHPTSNQLQSASDVFIERLCDQVNKEDAVKMVQAQQHMLSRFEKTNEMLLNFNVLARSRYETTCKEFKRHTQLLGDMKQDLDQIFSRIRTIKTTLGKQYPTAFSACGDVYSMLEEDEEEEDSTTAPKQESSTSVHSSGASALAVSTGTPAMGAPAVPTSVAAVDSPLQTTARNSSTSEHLDDASYSGCEQSDLSAHTQGNTTTASTVHASKNSNELPVETKGQTSKAKDPQQDRASGRHK